MPTSLSELEAQRERLKLRLSGLGDLRPGSLTERYRKCGKPNCHCAQPGQTGHGPSWSLTHDVKGKTATRIIPEALVPQTREQIAEYRRLRDLTRDLVEVNEKICEVRIESRNTEDDSKKTLLAAQLARDAAVEVDTLLGSGASDGMDFEAIETAVRRQVLGLAARAIEQRLNADTSDYAGPSRSCVCGQAARYAGRRTKTFQSILGELKLERAYYHCPHCSGGFCPRDRHLGIEKTCLSPATVRMIGTVGSMVSFQEGSQLLRELAGIGIDASQVERGSEALGGEIAADERIHIGPLEEQPLPPTLYLGLDGTGIPMRAGELAGRAGKQPDGSAKTREVKVCAVWSAEARDSEGLPMRDEGSVSYSAAIESAATPDTAEYRSAFAERVLREATRRRFGEAQRKIVIGDGAPWIWNMAQELFPGATQIVDRFHVKETLHRTAQSIFGSTGDQAKQWATARCAELDDGKLHAIVRALRPHAADSTEAARCRLYIWRNRQRMRYPQFRRQNLCTSSGVLEAGCKVAIGTRLKRAGMHWTLDGANNIIALRCCRLSGRFEDFWERRNASIAA